MDISMTTNGTLLENLALPLKQAGLNRVNIGCDSFQEMAGKHMDMIEKGIKAAKKAKFKPIKINMVVLKGINEDEINRMIDFARKNGFILQLIELINTDEEFFAKYHVDLQPIKKEIAKRVTRIEDTDMHDRKLYYLDDDAIIEFVQPENNTQFCKHCTTLRITHDFQFQTCIHEHDKLIPIDDDVESALLKAIQQRKPHNLETISKEVE